MLFTPRSPTEQRATIRHAGKKNPRHWGNGARGSRIRYGIRLGKQLVVGYGSSSREFPPSTRGCYRNQQQRRIRAPAVRPSERPRRRLHSRVKRPLFSRWHHHARRKGSERRSRRLNVVHMGRDRKAARPRLVRRSSDPCKKMGRDNCGRIRQGKLRRADSDTAFWGSWPRLNRHEERGGIGENPWVSQGLRSTSPSPLRRRSRAPRGIERRARRITRHDHHHFRFSAEDRRRSKYRPILANSA